MAKGVCAEAGWPSGHRFVCLEEVGPMVHQSHLSSFSSAAHPSALAHPAGQLQLESTDFKWEVKLMQLSDKFIKKKIFFLKRCRWLLIFGLLLQYIATAAYSVEIKINDTLCGFALSKLAIFNNINLDLLAR